MLAETLKQRIDFLPESLLGEVSSYLDFVFYKHSIAEKERDLGRDFTEEELAEFQDRLDELDRNPPKPLTMAEYKKRTLEMFEHELQSIEQYAS